MTRATSFRWFLAVAILAGSTLTACANPVVPPEATPAGIAADGKVLGQGTVLQIGDAPPQFCLGAVKESSPPHCSGPEIRGWEWVGVQGGETSGDTTWGQYAVQGTWDGAQLTVTDPPMWLPLFDPLPTVDPQRDPANAGATSKPHLVALQTALTRDTALRPLRLEVENGYLFVTVIYDDGGLQRYLDAAYGKDVVLVRNALRPVGS